MIIRRGDFKEVSKLTKGSKKKIWFVCDSCGMGVLQAYRNYLRQGQENGKLCRYCRNKHTASREDVKRKQSEASKKVWKNQLYRERMSDILSKSCKEAWNKDDGTRRSSIWNKTPYNTIKEMLTKEGYKMVTSESDYKTSNNTIKVSCNKGHTYNTNIGRWNQGHRCPECRKKPYDTIQRELEKEEYELLTTFEEYDSATKTTLKYKCPKGHIHEITWANWLLGHRCGKCFNVESKSERELYDYIKSIIGDVLYKDRKIISPYELDLVIPSIKIAIEYCGLYWHSEHKGKDENYHLHKLNLCNEKGYRLITIFEDEWMGSKELIKNKLKYLLKSDESKPLYARKCFVSECTSKEAKPFCEEYHIQGYIPSNVKLAAYNGDKIVAVMTFSKPSISKGNKDKEKGIWELSRFCTSQRVVGIAGKMLKHFQRNYEWSEIFSYADRRWSDGNLYERIGFELESLTKPSYWYFYMKQDYKNYRRFHRFNFRKNLLGEKLEVFNKNETEYENMLVNGWDRIWDCGNLKFVIKKPSAE